MPDVGFSVYETRFQQLVLRIAANTKTMQVIDICAEILDKSEYDKFPEILIKLNIEPLINALKKNTNITKIYLGAVGDTLDISDTIALQLCSVLEVNHTLQKISGLPKTKINLTAYENVLTELLKLNKFFYKRLQEKEKSSSVITSIEKKYEACNTDLQNCSMLSQINAKIIKGMIILAPSYCTSVNVVKEWFEKVISLYITTEKKLSMKNTPLLYDVLRAYTEGLIYFKCDYSEIFSMLEKVRTEVAIDVTPFYGCAYKNLFTDLSDIALHEMLNNKIPDVIKCLDDILDSLRITEKAKEQQDFFIGYHCDELECNLFKILKICQPPEKNKLMAVSPLIDKEKESLKLIFFRKLIAIAVKFNNEVILQRVRPLHKMIIDNLIKLLGEKLDLFVGNFSELTTKLPEAEKLLEENLRLLEDVLSIGQEDKESTLVLSEAKTTVSDVYLCEKIIEKIQRAANGNISKYFDIVECLYTKYGGTNSAKRFAMVLEAHIEGLVKFSCSTDLPSFFNLSKIFSSVNSKRKIGVYTNDFYQGLYEWYLNKIAALINRKNTINESSAVIQLITHIDELLQSANNTGIFAIVFCYFRDFYHKVFAIPGLKAEAITKLKVSIEKFPNEYEMIMLDLRDSISLAHLDSFNDVITNKKVFAEALNKCHELVTFLNACINSENKYSNIEKIKAACYVFFLKFSELYFNEIKLVPENLIFLLQCLHTSFAGLAAHDESEKIICLLAKNNLYFKLERVISENCSKMLDRCQVILDLAQMLPKIQDTVMQTKQLFALIKVYGDFIKYLDSTSSYYWQNAISKLKAITKEEWWNILVFFSENFELISSKHGIDKSLAVTSTTSHSLSFIPQEQIIIGKLLGEGGNAKVYQAIWKMAGEKNVALKCLENRMSKAKEDFEKEIGIISKLRHPNIVTVYGMSISENYFEIVMELMPLSLDHLLRDKISDNKIIEISQIVALQIMLKCAYGMNYLHGLKIIHRDIKSSNILCDFSFNVKIADFGLSRITPPPGVEMTKVTGTPAYAAPEIQEGKRDYTLKADVYSLAVLFWEILTRQIPYSECKNTWDIYSLIKSGKRLPISQDWDHDLVSLMRQCWYEQPEERPEMLTLKDELELIVERQIKTFKSVKISDESIVGKSEKMTSMSDEQLNCVSYNMPHVQSPVKQLPKRPDQAVCSGSDQVPKYSSKAKAQQRLERQKFSTKLEKAPQPRPSSNISASQDIFAKNKHTIRQIPIPPPKPSGLVASSNLPQTVKKSIIPVLTSLWRGEQTEDYKDQEMDNFTALNPVEATTTKRS